jgi:hypothetical protein
MGCASYHQLTGSGGIAGGIAGGISGGCVLGRSILGELSASATTGVDTTVYTAAQAVAGVGTAAQGSLLPLEEALAEALMGAEPHAYDSAAAAADSTAAANAPAASAPEPGVAYVDSSGAHGRADAALAEAARGYFGPSLEAVLLPLLQAPLTWLASAGCMAGIVAVNASSAINGFGGQGGSEITSPLLLHEDISASTGGRTCMQMCDDDDAADEGQAQ